MPQMSWMTFLAMSAISQVTVFPLLKHNER